MSPWVLRDVRPVPLRAGDRAPREPVDVAVEGERVVAVGSDLARPGSLVVDGGGGWLLPGLWDQHVHLGQWSRRAERLDLSSTESVQDALAEVRRRLVERPGAPVIGWGHRPMSWPEQPTVAALDGVLSEQAVVLICGDGHHGWLNSAALRALGLASREGVVAEGEWFEAYERLDALAPVVDEAALYRKAMQQAAARGVAGVVDFEFTGGAAEWRERWPEGAAPLRVRMATYAEGLDDVLARGLRTGDPISTDGLLTMGPLKVISDGSLNTRTAWCCDPYAEVGGHGQPNQSAAELVTVLSRGHAHGLEAAVHAIGDRAVQVALASFAETGARGSVEHVQLTTADDLRELARLGLRASVQPAHLLDDRDVAERLWPGRAERSFALRWMLDAGVDLRLGSDAPVAPLDPWLAMAAAVHRSADAREAWAPRQAISPREALAASTDGWGMVAAGHRADLVLLDADPLASGGDTAEAAAHLRDLGSRVAASWVGGRRVLG